LVLAVVRPDCMRGSATCADCPPAAPYQGACSTWRDQARHGGWYKAPAPVSEAWWCMVGMLLPMLPPPPPLPPPLLHRMHVRCVCGRGCCSPLLMSLIRPTIHACPSLPGFWTPNPLQPLTAARPAAGRRCTVMLMLIPGWTWSTRPGRAGSGCCLYQLRRCPARRFCSWSGRQYLCSCPAGRSGTVWRQW
jgi:hypothetical protein